MSICHAPRERVSWNPQNTESGWLRWVTLHVSVWVEMETPPAIICVVFVTLHVSVWVEMRVGIGDWRIPNVTLHVSVWVEIKAEREKLLKRIGHAPRERVSWNFSDRGCRGSPPVTLHVSVWVEICGIWKEKPWRTSRSTWACELKFCTTSNWPTAARSRSTWACELKYYADVMFL